MIQKLIIIDNVLENFNEYKEEVLNSTFIDVVSQKIKYKDMSQSVDPKPIYNKIEGSLNLKTVDKTSFLRAYIDTPEYRHPMWIHSDVLFSQYIGVFFIQGSGFPQDDGLSIWKNNELGVHYLDNKDKDFEQKSKIVDSQSLDPEKWSIIKRAEFKENRLVLFPATWFHSKTTYGNYGKELKDARIIHVLFFDVDKTE